MNDHKDGLESGLHVRNTWISALHEHAKAAGCSVDAAPPWADEGLLAWARRLNLPESLVTQATATTVGVPFVQSLNSYGAAGQFLKHFPIGFARKHVVLAVGDEIGSLTLAMPSLDAWPCLDLVGRLLSAHVTPLFAPREEITRAINAAYEHQVSEPGSVLGSISHEESNSQSHNFESLDDLLATDGQPPVVELVNLLLLDAVKGGASDIHFQPYRDKLVIRYRIDGVLFNAHTVPKSLQEEAISRVKVMGKMNIAEKRLPQDGRATVTVGDRLIDLRIASLPGNYGERVVLRLLDKSARLYTLDDVGMNEAVKQQFRELIEQEHGLILLTGPTGSGKTTTLYGALSEINTRDRNVVTLEDPIEYDIEGISQTQINVKKGLTFASGLRNVLRQDPDIIMVGEIRDNETAVMGIQSALTGHLVFSTLHTNDAASAVARLLDLGIEPYLVSSSLLAVIAQRLVRKVCERCAQQQTLSRDEADALGFPMLAESQYKKGAGCEACRETGYRGRVAVCELLMVDEAVRRKIQCRASATEIRDAACERGMRLLREDGIDKVRSGITSPSEVARVTVREDF